MPRCEKKNSKKKCYSEYEETFHCLEEVRDDERNCKKKYSCGKSNYINPCNLYPKCHPCLNPTQPCPNPTLPNSIGMIPDAHHTTIANGTAVTSLQQVPPQCLGVRPGATIIIGGGPFVGVCTMNWIFRGRNQRLYGGSAGHCALFLTGFQPQDPRRGMMVWTPGTGPSVSIRDPTNPAVNIKVGNFVYAKFDEVTLEDFALFLIDRNAESLVNPQTCHFGGPTGILSEIVPITEPVGIDHVGNPEGLVNIYRKGIALGLPLEVAFSFFGVAATGDSGGPAQACDGRAVGLVNDIGQPQQSTGPVSSGQIVGARLLPALRSAEAALNDRFTLQTAPLLNPVCP